MTQTKPNTKAETPKPVVRKDVGAAWNKVGASGKYMFIKIQVEGKDYTFMMFENTYKTADNQPDFKIYPPKFDLAANPQVAPPPKKLAKPVTPAPSEENYQNEGNGEIE